jgi:type II secretory pathway pseudopilin PulG
MNRIHKIYRYTLIEILVAVAVLLVMMGFLFRFVISAQNLWSASNSRMNQYEQMQAVFDLLNEDFNRALFGKNDLYKNDKGEYDYYFYLLGGSINNTNIKGAVVIMFTNEEDKSSEDCGKLKTIVYWYSKEYKEGDDTNTIDDKRLYRFSGILKDDSNADKYFITEDNFNTIKNYVGACNYSGMKQLVKLFTDVTISERSDLEDYVVAEDIEKFEISGKAKEDDSTEKTISSGVTNAPNFIRVAIEVGVPDELKGDRSNEEVMDRSFSRIFFFDTTKN